MDAQDFHNIQEAYKEVYQELDEAEGSYGQTPKARSAMNKLALSRAAKPASEYGKRGEKTKKVGAAKKQTRRQDTLARGLSGGKKSYRPWREEGQRSKMTADDREEARSRSVEYGEGGTHGPGSVTKNPKKLRKQRAMGELGEGYDIYDIILSHLLDEGYAETTESAEVIMVNMSEEWRDAIIG